MGELSVHLQWDYLGDMLDLSVAMRSYWEIIGFEKQNVTLWQN